jgi:formate hydrogenlyase subunit 3/multisubunit Na+/H+ antiporter MnhD subunit
MSGVMIKTGIYGIVRMVILLGTPPSWWGWTLIAIGVTSGVLGVLYALAQHDIKRLLAYHSVENIGIIALGLGVGLLGVSAGSPAIAALGIAGGLLHVLNHALFKGLLFLGAGAVIHGTGTREIDHLGGLLKRMPWTGVTFLIGAVAISGLPPLNGFVSELLIYIGAFMGGQTLAWEGAAASIAGIGALALIGGLAAACFTKAFGAIFLGEPRSEHASHAHEAGMAMRAPMVVLAAGCVLIGLLSPLVVGQLGAVVALVTGTAAGEVSGPISQAVLAMWYVSAAAAALVVVATVLLVTRMRLLSKREVTEAGTWDCGYAEPTARMQYTSSSFAQPLVYLFRGILRTRRLLKAPKGFFPTGASFATETPDAAREGFYGPIFAWVGRALLRLGVLQQGSVHIYILYIVLTLLVLLVWKLG